MMDINKYKVIRVPYYLSKVWPLESHFNYTIYKINESKMFEYVCNSRIDGSPIYKLKEGTIRLLKLKKIIKDEEFISKVEKFFESIDINIEIIPIVQENYTTQI